MDESWGWRELPELANEAATSCYSKQEACGDSALDAVVTVRMLITVAVAMVFVTRSVTRMLVTTTVELVVVWVATIFVNDSTTVMVVTGAATVVVWAVTLIQEHALDCRTEPETS